MTKRAVCVAHWPKHGLESPCHEETEYTRRMEVTVLLFGPAAMAFGNDRAAVSTRPGTTCSELLSTLATQHAPLRPFLAPGVARLAINRTFAAPDQVVQAGDELALIAMVSGG